MGNTAVYSLGDLELSGIYSNVSQKGDILLSVNRLCLYDMWFYNNETWFVIQIERQCVSYIRPATERAEAKHFLQACMFAQRGLRSACADAQADLSLRWVHMQSCRKCCAPDK